LVYFILLNYICIYKIGYVVQIKIWQPCSGLQKNAHLAIRNIKLIVSTQREFSLSKAELFSQQSYLLFSFFRFFFASKVWLDQLCDILWLFWFFRGFEILPEVSFFPK
jgi:ABC-type polysaccharide transport system permease subunit